MFQKGDLVEYVGLRGYDDPPEMGIVLDVIPRQGLTERPLVVVYWVNEALMGNLHRRVPAQYLKRLA